MEEGLPGNLLVAACALPVVKRLLLKSFPGSYSKLVDLEQCSSSVEELHIIGCEFDLKEIQKVVGASKRLLRLVYRNYYAAGTPRGVLGAFASQFDSLEELTLYHWALWRFGKLHRAGIDSDISFEDFKALQTIKVEALLFIDSFPRETPSTRLEIATLSRMARALPSTLRTIHFTKCNDANITPWLERIVRERHLEFPQVRKFIFEVTQYQSDNSRAEVDSLAMAAQSAGIDYQILAESTTSR